VVNERGRNLSQERAQRGEREGTARRCLVMWENPVNSLGDKNLDQAMGVFN
jgi:hypothetical protein